MSDAEPIVYHPNGMVKALHRTAHVSSSKFDLDDADYRLSLIVLGSCTLAVALAVFVMLVRYYACGRIKAPRVHRPSWRVLSLAMFLCLAGIITMSALFSWETTNNGLKGVSDDLGEVKALATQLADASDLVVVSGNELITAMFDESDACPELLSHARSFNQSFPPVAQEYADGTKNLPSTLESIEPALEDARKWAKISLAIPLSVVLFVSLVGLVGLVFNSWGLQKLTQTLFLVAFFLVSLVVVGEMVATVAGGDLCVNADENVVELVHQLANNRTYWTARYYSSCEEPNVIEEPLYSALDQLSSLYDDVSTITNCSSRAISDVLERVSIAQSLILYIQTRAECPALNKLWASLVHDNVCDKVIPGVAWLWIAQFGSLLLMTASVFVSRRVVLSFRRSMVFADPETAPLYGLRNSDSFVKSAAPAYDSFN